MVSMRRQVALAAAAVLALFGVGEHMPLRAQEQGIKVHGRWTIDVRNPDGTLSSRHEFDNALTAGGAVYLARLLGRDGVPTRWVIQLGRYSMAGPCQGGIYARRVFHRGSAIGAVADRYRRISELDHCDRWP
jgi:hypothetical protein